MVLPYMVMVQLSSTSTLKRLNSIQKF